MRKSEQNSQPAIIDNAASETTNSRYATLYELAPIAYLTLTGDGEIYELNPAAAQLMGRNRTELTGLQFVDFLEPDSQPIFHTFFNKVFSHETAQTCEVSLLNGAYSSFYLSLSGISAHPDQCLLTATDITKCKVIEDKLLENIQMLKETQVIAHLGTYVLDIATGWWTCCDTLESVFGIDKDYKKTIDNWLAIVHPEFREEMADYFTNEVVGKKSRFDKTYKIIRVSDGVERWVHGMGTLKFDHNSQPISMVGTIRDITENKLMESALMDSISSLNASLESTADGILIVSATGKITKWNKKFVDMWRMSEPLLSSSDDSVAIRYILSMLVDPDQFLDKVKYLYARPEETSFDQIDFLDGRIFERYSQPQKIGENIVGRVWSFRDVTIRKHAEKALQESEEKYRTIFDNVQDVFYQTDLDGQILEISPSIKYFSEFDRDEIIGTFFQNHYYNPEDRITLVNAIINNGEVRDYELKIKTKIGTIMYTSINARLVFDAEGRPNHIAGAIRDLTERKKNEIEIAQQNWRLEMQNKELEQFAYITSHDLQEPLRNLIGITGLLKAEFAGKMDASADQYLNYIIQSSGRMQELVRGLSDYARIGKEKDLAEVNCVQVLQEVLDDMSVLLKEMKAKIILQDLPCFNGYYTEIRQLFQNLISNAIKFRRKDVAPEIFITAHKQTSGWQFAVQDNGIGIEEHNREKIFVIFKRLHNRHEYEGTGIGLSYCKKIVELHGGNIWVDSTPGIGSTFYITILNL